MPENNPNPLFENEVVVECCFEGAIQTDLAYGDEGRVMDIYYPKMRDSESTNSPPVIVFVTGYPDPGFLAMTGKEQRQMPQYQSWARLLAANGLVAVCYHSVTPPADALRVVKFLRQNSASLNIDGSNIGLWSCSGNVANALHLIALDSQIAAAVLCYGFTLDLAGSTLIADAASKYRFANPLAGSEKFPECAALMLIKAGRDEFKGLNESMTIFHRDCLIRGLDAELVNYDDGVHAFDILDESEESQALIRQQINFFQEKLNALV